MTLDSRLSSPRPPSNPRSHPEHNVNGHHNVAGVSSKGSNKWKKFNKKKQQQQQQRSIKNFEVEAASPVPNIEVEEDTNCTFVKLRLLDNKVAIVNANCTKDTFLRYICKLCLDGLKTLNQASKEIKDGPTNEATCESAKETPTEVSDEETREECSKDPDIAFELLDDVDALVPSGERRTSCASERGNKQPEKVTLPPLRHYSEELRQALSLSWFTEYAFPEDAWIDLCDPAASKLCKLNELKTGDMALEHSDLRARTEYIPCFIRRWDEDLKVLPIIMFSVCEELYPGLIGNLQPETHSQEKNNLLSKRRSKMSQTRRKSSLSIKKTPSAIKSAVMKKKSKHRTSLSVSPKSSSTKLALSGSGPELKLKDAKKGSYHGQESS